MARFEVAQTRVPLWGWPCARAKSRDRGKPARRSVARRRVLAAYVEIFGLPRDIWNKVDTEARQSQSESPRLLFGRLPPRSGSRNIVRHLCIRIADRFSETTLQCAASLRKIYIR